MCSRVHSEFEWRTRFGKQSQETGVRTFAALSLIENGHSVRLNSLSRAKDSLGTCQSGLVCSDDDADLGRSKTLDRSLLLLLLLLD